MTDKPLPLSPERARLALAANAQWHKDYGRLGAFVMRDVGAELTDVENDRLWAYFADDPRRPTITCMVEICAGAIPAAQPAEGQLK